MKILSGKSGFTLVELLIVVLILAALAAIAVPRIGASAANARIRACDTNISIINSQIELYEANEGVPPGVMTDVTNNTNYFPDGPPMCPFSDGTTFPYKLDAASGHVDTSNHQH